MARPRRALIGVAASILGHGLILLALLAARPHRIEAAEEPVLVTLTPVERLIPPARDKASSSPAAGRPRARPVVKPPPDVKTIPVVVQAASAEEDVGEGELAGAAGVGSGGGGGGCDMVARLQDALRKDGKVQAAIAEVDRGRAIRIWNGGWVLHQGQEGNGLAVLREAIAWEVGFAPPACKAQRMHGLVLISLGDRSGAARLVIGTADWRWSDLTR